MAQAGGRNKRRKKRGEEKVAVKGLGTEQRESRKSVGKGEDGCCVGTEWVGLFPTHSGSIK